MPAEAASDHASIRRGWSSHDHAGRTDVVSDDDPAEVVAQQPRRPDRRSMVVPRWFGALLVAIAAGVTGGGLAGVVLAVAGAYDWRATVVVGAATAAAVTDTAWRFLPRGTGHGWAAAAAVVCVAFVGANWNLTAETVVLERDAGLYSATARWLDREGSLLVDADAGPFADAPGVSFRSVGMYEHGGEGMLEFQGNHLAPVLLATGYGAGGASGLFHVPMLLVAVGLLAVWALAARVTGSGAAALVAIVALAWSLPVLGVARDTLSEPVVLVLLWSGLWVWTVAADRSSPPAAALAGLFVGACLAARIDAAAYLVPVPIVLALHGRRHGWSLVRAFALGIVPGAAVAALDVGLRSRGYLGDLEIEATLLYALLALSVVAAVVVARWRRPLRIPTHAPDVAAIAVVALLLLAWFVRPHVQTVLADDSLLVRTIQEGQGIEVDGRRRYHELSMVWQWWYLGVPIMLAAVIGAGIVARRLIAGVDRAVRLPLVALGAASALYLYRPAISPDHLWAMRRFVPATLPLWCVLAGIAAVAGLALLPRRAPMRVGAGVVTAVVAIAPVVDRTWPSREFQEFDGFLAGVEATCELVGPDAAIVAPDDRYSGAALTQSFRSWCGVPAAIIDDDADLDALAAAWAAEGRELWLVVSDERAPVPEGQLVEVWSHRMLEDTLTRPPDGYWSHRLGLVVTRVGGA